MWGSGQFEPCWVGQVVMGHTIHSGPAHSNRFSIIPNCSICVKYKVPSYVAAKFTRLCMTVEYKIWNNLPFVRKFKLQIEFELKFQESN
jgi:hypothetical protein